MIGLYTPRDSTIHQLRPGVKLAGLITLSLVLAVFTGGSWLVVSGGAVVTLWLLARLPLGVLASDLRPLVWLLIAIVLFHAVFGQAWQGGIVAGRLLVLVAAAMLLTRTTPVTELLATLERLAAPIRVIGLRPDRIAFLVVLTIRFVPVIVAIMAQVREAARARGARRALGPVSLAAASRAVLLAGQVGDALDARSPRGSG